jgi:hypothetical protein
MAMKTCKECGKEVSSSAKTCPNCGAKQGTGCIKIGFIAFGVLVVLGVIVILRGGGDKSTSTSSAPTASPGAGKTEPAVTKEYITEGCSAVAR